MPFFRKKKEELPDSQDYGFPELEQLKESFEKIKAELSVKEATEAASPNPALPELPEAPDAPMLGPTLPELPELPEEPAELELAKPIKLETKPKTVASAEKKVSQTAKAARPLFIKVDRFKLILASVEVIGEKIEEIDRVVQKLRNIREKENETMKQWESEIQELKSKLETIEKTLTAVQ